MNWRFWRKPTTPTELASVKSIPVINIVGHDAPVTHRDDDLLDRWLVGKAIWRTIETTPPTWSTRIGLYGKWGTGKTSVLNFLQKICESQNAIVVPVSAWSAVGEAGVLELFYRALKQRMREEKIGRPILQRLKSALAWIVWPIVKLLDLVRKVAAGSSTGEGQAIVGGSIVANAALRKLADWTKISRRDLVSLLKPVAGRRVIVFIDDIDRADPKIVPKTLLGLRELLDWPGFAFVLAFDHHVVATALTDYSKAYGDLAEHFLEKIVDVRHDLPEPTQSQSTRLALEAMETCCPFIPQEPRLQSAKWFPRNPRRAKLIARSLGLFRDAARRHNDSDLNWYAIILQLILRVCAPKTSQFIEEALTSSDTEFKLLLLNEQLSERIAQAVAAQVDIVGGTNRQELSDLVHALISARGLDKPHKIVYEMGLSVYEPCFTELEANEICASQWPGLDDTSVKGHLTLGAARGNTHEGEAAVDLVKMAIFIYENRVNAAPDTRFIPELNSVLGESGRVLGALEYLWNSCDVPDMRRATTLHETTWYLFSIFLGWINFQRNSADLELRVREVELLKRAALLCGEPARLYFELERVFRERNLGPGREAKEKLRVELRSVLAGAAVSATIGLFTTREGVRNASREATGELKRMLRDVESPLYTDPIAHSRLCAVLRGEEADDDEAMIVLIASNALDYLELLADRLSQTSLDLRPKQFFEANPTVISSAWGAVTRVELQFRMLSGVRDLRSRLVDSGIFEQLLPQPEWLLRE